MQRFITGGRRRKTIGGTYGKLVDALYRKYNMTAKDGYSNPCRVINVLLADDDVFCNTTLTTIIESSGQYRVFPFFNGSSVRPSQLNVE